MRRTRVQGIKLDYFRWKQLPSLNGFKHPTTEKFEPKRISGTLYETEGDFRVLENTINSSIAEGENSINKRTEGYAVARDKTGKVVGFAYTDGSYVEYEEINGRKKAVPGISFVYTHPDYRNRRIGTALVEELLQHHPFLLFTVTSYLSSRLKESLSSKYGLPGHDNIIANPAKAIKS